MEENHLEQEIRRVAALQEPARRALYFFVAAHGEPVGRDDAARATGVTRALAAFHLDKLVAEGLLEVEFRRLSGRRGPGAGRPSKLYRRAHPPITVSLPQREYELAARLFARALAHSGDANTTDAVQQQAEAFGRQLGEEAARRAGPGAGPREKSVAALQMLRTHGFEPFLDSSGIVRLRNCPFDAIRDGCRELVCGMNLALIGGVLRGSGLDARDAQLEPRPGLCCVALRPPDPGARDESGAQAPA